ncbi:hypothetical protein ACFL6S_03430 [Candidatus Poribacteria bacterium]
MSLRNQSNIWCVFFFFFLILTAVPLVSAGSGFGATPFYLIPYNYTANEAPVVQSVSIVPASPYDRSNLTCQFNVTDGDGDNLTVSVAWFYRNESQSVWQNWTWDNENVSADSGLINETSPAGSVEPENTTLSQQWKCQIVPSDGTDTGSGANSTAVTIQNDPTSPGSGGGGSTTTTIPAGSGRPDACHIYIDDGRSIEIWPCELRDTTEYHIEYITINNTGQQSESVKLNTGMVIINIPENGASIAPGEPYTFELMVCPYRDFCNPFLTYTGFVTVSAFNNTDYQDMKNVSVIMDASALPINTLQKAMERLIQGDIIGFFSILQTSLSEVVYTAPAGVPIPKWFIPGAVLILLIFLRRKDIKERNLWNITAIILASVLLFIACALLIPSETQYAPEIIPTEYEPPESVLAPACSVDISGLRSIEIDPCGVRSTSSYHTDRITLRNTGSSDELVKMELTSELDIITMPVSEALIKPEHTRTFSLLVDGHLTQRYEGFLLVNIYNYDRYENIRNVSLMYEAAELEKPIADIISERDSKGFALALWDSLNQPIYEAPNGMKVPKWILPLAIIALALVWKRKDLDKKKMGKQALIFLLFAAVMFLVFGVFVPSM